MAEGTGKRNCWQKELVKETSLPVLHILIIINAYFVIPVWKVLENRAFAQRKEERLSI